jgi:hypothetical protein
MQTFVPIATTDFIQIAKTLDNKRLNKQALEGWQILMTLLELDPLGNHRTPKGWVNHPAVKMWRGSETLLMNYVVAMGVEWSCRGYSTTIPAKAMETWFRGRDLGRVDKEPVTPEWMTDKAKFEEIASTHRTALLHKDYEWYSQFHWAEDTGSKPDTYEYIWE